MQAASTMKVAVLTNAYDWKKARAPHAPDPLHWEA